MLLIKRAAPRQLLVAKSRGDGLILDLGMLPIGITDDSAKRGDCAVHILKTADQPRIVAPEINLRVSSRNAIQAVVIAARGAEESTIQISAHTELAIGNASLRVGDLSFG